MCIAVLANMQTWVSKSSILFNVLNFGLVKASSQHVSLQTSNEHLFSSSISTLLIILSPCRPGIVLRIYSTWLIQASVFVSISYSKMYLWHLSENMALILFFSLIISTHLTCLMSIQSISILVGAHGMNVYVPKYRSVTKVTDEAWYHDTFGILLPLTSMDFDEIFIHFVNVWSRLSLHIWLKATSLHTFLHTAELASERRE